MQQKSTCLFLSVSLTKYCSLILPLHYTTFPVLYCRDIKSGRHGNSSLQRWILVCEKSLCFRLCCNRSFPEDSLPNMSLRERSRDIKRDKTGTNSEVCFCKQLVMGMTVMALKWVVWLVKRLCGSRPLQPDWPIKSTLSIWHILSYTRALKWPAIWSERHRSTLSWRRWKIHIQKGWLGAGRIY